MKNIKRIIIAVLALMVCLSFASCNKKTDKENKVEVETKKPQQQLELTVEHTDILAITKDDNSTVRLRDNKDNVIKALGAPSEERQYSLIYDGATVYIQDTVNMITVNGEGYTGYGNATIGMSIDEFKKGLADDEYSIEEQKDIGFYRITISADAEGNIIKAPDNTKIAGAEYVYTVTSNNYGKTGTITHIQLKDNKIGD